MIEGLPILARRWNLEVFTPAPTMRDTNCEVCAHRWQMAFKFGRIPGGFALEFQIEIEALVCSFDPKRWVFVEYIGKAVMVHTSKPMTVRSE